VAFSLTHYLPSVDNDEIAYFLQIKTFAFLGFNGGYFSVNDRVPTSHVHFGPHGPAFIAVYGLIARLIGWHNYSPYVVNLLFLVVAGCLLMWALREEAAKRTACALFVLLHGHVVLFLPSMMQESFHISLAVFIAAMWKLARDRRSLRWDVALVGVVLFATLTRFSWGFILPIVLFSVLRRRVRTRIDSWTADLVLAIGCAFAGAVATDSVFRLWVFWGAPAADRSAAQFPAIGPLVTTAVENLRKWFLPGIDIFAAYPLYFRMSVTVFMIIFCWTAVRARSARNREAATYSMFLLAVPFVLQLTFYVVDGYREFRVLAGFHTLAALFFLSAVEGDPDATFGFKRFGAPAIMSALAILFAVNIALTYRAARSAYGRNWPRVEAVAFDEGGKRAFATMSARMALNDEDTAYCKTVYVPSPVYYDPRIINMPYGFGVSVVEPQAAAALPLLRGKYTIVVKPEAAFVQAFDTSADWLKVGAFGDYLLYRATHTCLD
jgi:hypothetical protein